MLGEYRPHVLVHAGDRFEAAAASVHGNEHQHTLRDEYEAAYKASVCVRRAVGRGCRLVWLLGNHDDNLQAQDPRRIPPALRGSAHWNRSEWGAEFRRWQQLPYVKSPDGCFSIGQLVVAHGFDSGETSDELEALQLNMMTGGRPHRLFVRAHTHRPAAPFQLRRTSKVLLPYWAANVGTLGPLKPAWTQRLDTSRWAPGVLLVDIDADSRCNARNWEARLCVFPDPTGQTTTRKNRRAS